MPTDQGADGLSCEEADVLTELIETFSETYQSHRVMIAMTEKGFSVEEVDAALRKLGAIAGREAGWL